MFTRRQFLIGTGMVIGTGASGAGLITLKRASLPQLRPPGALPPQEFLAACIRCGQCVEACPYDALHPATLAQGVAVGAPVVAPRESPCKLCQGYDELKCIIACPTPALQPVAEWRDIRMGAAVIHHDTCLAWQGTPCRACWHACPFPNEAIELDERGRAILIAEKCVGCGMCDHACITEPSSITIIPRSV